MEYLDGCSLADIVSEEGALPIPWVIDILEPVCSAVETAHQAGGLYRPVVIMEQHGVRGTCDAVEY